mmetsp:Transcript_136141/g.435488  ORF Transcript_136141/g.435488 Transcript_136141/m.435488 type:complete len:1005 (-) Transcript_136141:205-3219(-)
MASSSSSSSGGGTPAFAAASAASPTPAPAAQQPVAVWPATTVAGSHAAWPQGHQPKAAENWPLKENGLPDGCWKTTVLQDMHLGWPCKCRDLTRTSSMNALECHETCTRNPMCSVWQYNYMTQCWQGVGHICGSDEWKGSDLLSTGAQRVQHGDVYVLKNMRGWEIKGLGEVGDTTWGSSNHTEGIVNCRAWCYSNLRCQFWSYTPGKCFAEDPGGHRKAIAYPLVNGVNAFANSDLAHTVLAGEFISHRCPPEPARAAVQKALVTDGHMGPAEIFLDLVVGVLLLWAFARVWFRMRGEDDKCKVHCLEGHVQVAVDEEEQPALASSKSMAAFRPWEDHIMPATWETVVTPGLLDTLLHREFATSKERKAVRKVAPEAPPSYANYLAWRRSFVASLFILGVVSFIMQVRVLCSTWRHHIYFSAKGRDPLVATYQTWVAGNPPNPSFIEYSKAKMLTLLAGVLGEVLRGAFLTDLVVCTLELAPMILLLMAVVRWTSFTSSRSMVLWAWATSFIVAFGMSLFPVRSLLYFKNTELEADAYVHELAVALNLDKAQTLLLGSCDQIGEERFVDRVNMLGNSLKKLCDNLSIFPIELTVPCVDSFALCHINLGEAMDGCSEAVQQFENGRTDKATAILKEQCNKIRSAFTSPTSVEDKADSKVKAFDALVNIMRYPLRLVVPSVELTSLTISALHTVLMVLPSVVGIPPGFMAAGYISKVLAPHSALPGAVIILVPIILATVTWLVYTVLFQYITQNCGLMLLLICVCYPLVYVMIVVRFELMLPVKPHTLYRAAQASTITNVVLAVLAGVLIYFMSLDVDAKTVDQMKTGADLLAWCHVSWSRLGLAVVSRTIYAFVLTYFGASDWMIADVAVQQRYWNIWAQKRSRAMSPEVCQDDDEDDPYKMGGKPRGYSSATGLAMRFGPEDDTSGEEDVVVDEAQLDHDVCELLRHRQVNRGGGMNVTEMARPMQRFVNEPTTRLLEVAREGDGAAAGPGSERLPSRRRGQL